MGGISVVKKEQLRVVISVVKKGQFWEVISVIKKWQFNMVISLNFSRLLWSLTPERDVWIN